MLGKSRMWCLAALGVGPVAAKSRCGCGTAPKRPVPIGVAHHRRQQALAGDHPGHVARASTEPHLTMTGVLALGVVHITRFTGVASDPDASAALKQYLKAEI